MLEKIVTMLLNGLSLGGIYAIIALGYTMVYGIAKMLNFAHGDIIMVGGYSIVVFVGLTDNPVLAVLFSVIVCVIFGVVIERFAYRPLRGASPLAVLITAIGVSYLLQSLAQICFGSGAKLVNVFRFGSVKIGNIAISGSTLLTLVVAVVIMVGLTLFVSKTKKGRAMLAVSEDRGAASLMGIKSNAIIALTFTIGSALAGMASMFYIMKTSSVSVTMGAMPGIKAFTAAVIGGIGSIPGAMLGGIFLGLVETVCSSIPAISNYTIAIEFGFLILILLVRPTGFIGKKKREKV